MQTDGLPLPVRGYAQLPGVWAARDTTVQSPTQSSPAQRRERRSPALQQSRRLSPMRSPSPSRRTSNLLASFSRSPVRHVSAFCVRGLFASFS